jgi:hypothetical protein
LAITAAAQSQQGLRGIFLPQSGARQLDIQGVSETVLKAVSHTLVHLAPSATPQETRPLEWTEFGLYFRVAPAVRLHRQTSMRCSRCFLFQGEETQKGELFLTVQLFSLNGGLVGSRAGRHLCPGNFTLDDPRRIAVISATVPELETIGIAGIGPAIAQEILLGLGEGHALVGRGVVLGALPDRDADAGASGGSGAAIEGLQSGIFLVVSLGGRKCLLILEFM